MVEVIKIVNTHGVKGDVKAIYYADSPAFFKKVPCLYDKKGKEYKVYNIREHKGALLLNIEGIEDMTAAEMIKGVSLYAKREDFPPLPKGEYYLMDLEGLKAVTKNGEVIGVVQSVLEKTAQNLLLVKTPDDREILIPKCDAFVDEINLEEGKIVITPIEGLI